MRPARLAAGAALALAWLVAGAADGTRTYDFQALLDGKPIGRHVFTVRTQGDAREVSSEADFRVRFLGITAYRYRHHADEQWRGDCLQALSASTDDDGKPASVRLSRRGEANEITTAAGTRSEPGCLMSFAYWNPALREQQRLLNPQTGKLEAVRIERVADGRIAVAGREVEAADWRITGQDIAIDVWISPQGDWVGLDSVVAKGRHRLSYRLP